MRNGSSGLPPPSINGVIIINSELRRGASTVNFGPTELIIILVIVILLFGVGRVGRIGGELGSAVANFRKGMEEGSKKDKPTDETNV
ncbi:MAG: twin-arginine translocase TatA/TatE family subunit [Anaerolineae bacterium]|nr:twin-arginine translocase TatA/TatE family subunit [Anaerolineae bacterium]